MPKITQVPQIPIPQMPAPVTVRWRDWSEGFNSQDDPIDLPLGASEEVINFELSSRGKLVDINGYSTALSNIPSGLAIARVFKYKVTKPSAQDITIVIGEKGGLKKVYAVNTTLFARAGDSNGWRDLTEYVQATTAVGTGTTTTIVDLGALSKVADAQKGYYIINLDQGTSSIVTASSYSAGLWTLTTANSLGGIDSESVLVMRYPLIGYFVPGVATDYDLSYTDADDISFTLDNENLRINFGSDSDTARGLWFGYIDRFCTLAGTQPSDVTDAPGYSMAGWVCENQDLLRYTRESFTPTATTETTTYPGLPADDYYFKISFMYDGNQEAPPNTFDSAAETVTLNGSQYLSLFAGLKFFAHTLGTDVTDESIYVRGGNVFGAPMFMSWRMTDVNVYLSNDKVNFYLVESHTLNWEFGSFPSSITGLTLPVGNTEWLGRGGEYSDRTGFGSSEMADISATGNYPTNPTSVGYCAAQTMVRGRRIIGSTRQPEDGSLNEQIFRIAAAMPHSNGTFNNDVFGLSLYEHIDIRTKQADAVMGLEELNGGLIAIKQNSLHAIDFGGGRMDTWTIAMSNEDVGAVSRASIVRVPNGVIFSGSDNIFFTDGIKTVSIADTWRDEYQAKSLAVRENARAAYYPKKDQYRITFTDTDVMYIYNLKERSWTTNSTLDSDPLDLLADPDGNFYWLASDELYLMDDSSASIGFLSSVKTSIKELDPEYVWKVKKIFATFKETTDTVAVVIYTDHGATVKETVTFTGTGAVITLGKRVSVEVDDIQLKYVTGVNADYTSELHELRAVVVPVRRRRAAI